MNATEEFDEEFVFDCGMDSHGLCSMAGTEDCDECPVREVWFSARRKAELSDKMREAMSNPKYQHGD